MGLAKITGQNGAISQKYICCCKTCKQENGQKKQIEDFNYILRNVENKLAS